MNSQPFIQQKQKKKVLSLLATLSIGLVIWGGLWTAVRSVRADANLTIRINTAYNLVVDSNVTSPSTYAPRAATVYGTFCNTGDEDLTDVYGYIGNYAANTPGIYPANSSWTIDPGSPYSFQHIGGTADASRYIGDLTVGECKVQYWHFTYPTCTNDNAGGAFATPCTTTPTWGSSVKPDDDLSLSFDMWAKANNGTVTDNASHTMTMRNEISAMANKIKPNPDGNWFNTDTTTIVPGQVITTNGVLYTLGNVRQGFDNDGDFVPDYNAWLQPFGDPSYDPSCFRLIRTTTALTVSRSAGQPNLILHTNDLNPHPIYGGPLYFTNLPPDNNGVRGEVRYTFLALTGPCSVPISPYQEVASGSDNEKFNGDYGTGIPTVQSSAPEVTISKSGSPNSVALNADITYSIPFANQSSTYAAGLTLSSGGINMPLVIRDQVPAGLLYLANSATNNNVNPTDCLANCYTIRYSTNGGATWTTTDPGNTLSTAANPVVIEWWLTNPLPTNGSGTVRFQARVPSTYTGPSFIENEACANFGGGTDFACDTDVTMVQGNNSVGDFVWRDLDADGVQDGGGETGIENITVWLYWDVNGDGLQDDGDLLIATANTNSSGGYSFGQLPDGNYLVVVDSADPDLPMGYANTTPAVIAVPLDPTSASSTAVTVTTADFGFGPVLSLEKTLTSGNPAYEGQFVTFDLALTNNLPSGPSDEFGYCTYTYWANTATTSGNSQRLFTAPNNILGEPDVLYASAASATGNRRWIYGRYNISNLGTSIINVEPLYELGTSAPLSGDVTLFVTRDPSVAIADNNPLGNIPVADQYPVAAASVPIDLTLYDNWEVADLTWTILSDPNFKFGVVLDGQGGGPLHVGALGLRITTNQLCGGSSSTVDPLPLTDSYDADKLEFVSATPAESATGTAVTPYANTGTISWNNLGPLHAGGTQTVQVTFRVLEPAGNAATDTINYAAVNGATFSNGRPTNQPTAQAPVAINPTGSLSGVVWNDNGPTNGNIDGSEQGIAGVTVYLCTSLPCNSGTAVATTTTDANGAYSFTGLQDGNYYTAVDTPTLPGGATQTGDPDQPGVICTICDNQTTNPVTISGANDVVGINYGYTVANYIYGTVWQDNNGDSDRDSDDDGISSVTVYLCTVGSNPCDQVATTTTNSSGAYLFSNVPDGNYYIQVANTAAPLGVDWQNTRDSEGAPGNHQSDAIIVSGGNGYGSYDFGYHQTGPHSIAGNVYADWNGNADFDGNDTGFGGIAVTLYSDTGAVIATTTTNPDGSYTFPNLPNGTYTVVVDNSSLPPQYSQTEDWDEIPGACATCDGRASVTISGAPVTGVDFGYEPAGYGAIGDRVWRDNNGDGYQTPGEPGIANIAVNLYVDYGDGYVLVTTTQTDGDGLYSFLNLPPGSYRVEVDVNDTDLPNDSYGNDFVLTTDSFFDVTLDFGETYLDADFGFAPGGVIGNTIYWDANGNAEQDWNEVGIPGVGVTLQVWNGSAWVFYANDTTDANGEYLFTGLPAGEYRVVVNTGVGSPVNGRTLTGDPDTNGIPCHPNPGAPWDAYCDSMHSVEIRPGQTYLGANFGYQPVGVIGDFVWLDLDGDGMQDPGEPGLPEVLVTITNGVDTFMTTTDPDGYYSFANVPDGNWTVTFAGPVGTTPTTGPQSVGAGTIVVISGGAVSSIGGNGCSDCSLNIDAGFTLAGDYSISGTVFYDLNENGGDQEAGEPGYEGQNVYLWQLVGSSYVLVGTTTTNANGDYTFPNLPNGSYVVSTEATSPNLNNATHTTGSSNQNTGTVYESATINNASVNDVDFGFFIATDFDDLPHSYQTQLSGGPYHINSGAAGTLRLGAGIDLEPNGLPDTMAALDTYDDGVRRDLSTAWTPGAAVQLVITVTNGSGVVGGWFDWNNDGDFTDAGEFINFGALSAGVHTVSFTIPNNYTTGQTVYARFRVFDPANIPGGALTAVDYQGGATGGEVEGYRWTFSPTAVTLSSLSVNSATPVFLLTGLLLLALATIFMARRRRS